MIFCSLSLVNSEALLLKPLSHRRGDKDKSKFWIKNVFVLLKATIRHLHQAEIILVASTSWTQPFHLLIGMEWETNTESDRLHRWHFYCPLAESPLPDRSKIYSRDSHSIVSPSLPRGLIPFLLCLTVLPSPVCFFARPQSPSAHLLLSFYPVCLKKRAHGS